MMPSTAMELQKWLEEQKLYPYHAAADGSEPYDGYALRRRDAGWVIYLCAMMTAPRERYFDNEADAVAHFWELLRRDGFVRS